RQATRGSDKSQRSPKRTARSRTSAKEASGQLAFASAEPSEVPAIPSPIFARVAQPTAPSRSDPEVRVDAVPATVDPPPLDPPPIDPPLLEPSPTDPRSFDASPIDPRSFDPPPLDPPTIALAAQLAPVRSRNYRRAAWRWTQRLALFVF